MAQTKTRAYKTLKEWNLFAQWQQSMERFVIGDIQRALKQRKNAPSVGLVIMTLVGIEALSAFYTGKTRTTSGTFKKFMDAYLPGYEDYVEDIYKYLRDGLLHNYVINRVEHLPGKPPAFVLKHYMREEHLKPLRKGQRYPIVFNRSRFARDFLAAWKRYKTDVETDRDLFTKMATRAHNVGLFNVYPENRF